MQRDAIAGQADHSRGFQQRWMLWDPEICALEIERVFQRYPLKPDLRLIDE